MTLSDVGHMVSGHGNQRKGKAMKAQQEIVTRAGATWKRLFDSVTGELVAEVNLDVAFGEETAALFETAPALISALEDILDEPETAVERAQAAVSLLRAKIG